MIAASYIRVWIDCGKVSKHATRKDVIRTISLVCEKGESKKKIKTKIKIKFHSTSIFPRNSERWHWFLVAASEGENFVISLMMTSSISDLNHSENSSIPEKEASMDEIPMMTTFVSPAPR